MNVTVRLLIAQRQDVNPLCIDSFANCLCRLINRALKSKIFIEG